LPSLRRPLDATEYRTVIGLPQKTKLRSRCDFRDNRVDKYTELQHCQDASLLRAFERLEDAVAGTLQRWFPVNRKRQPYESRHILLNRGQHIPALYFIKIVARVDTYKAVCVVRTVLVKSRANFVDDTITPRFHAYSSLMLREGVARYVRYLL
jgi:hypothetical protein